LATIKNSFGEAIGGIGGAIQEGVKAGTQLDQLAKQIEKTQNGLIFKQAELNNEFEKQKSIAEDVTKSEEERVTAAQAAQAALTELQNEQQKLIDLRIEEKELTNSLNDTSRADDAELQQLLADRVNFESEATAKIVSVRNLENSIKQGIANEEKARQAEAQANQNAINKENTVASEKRIAEAQKVADEQAKIAQGLADDKVKNEQILNTKLLALSEFRRSEANEGMLNEAESMQEFYELRNEMAMEDFERERERILEENEVTAEDANLTAEEKAIRQADNDLIIEELKKGHAERMAAIANDQKNEELKIEEDKASKRQAITQAANQAMAGGFEIANNVIDNFYQKRYANIEAQLKNGNITEEEYAKKKEQIDKNKAKALHKADVAEFRVQKATALVQAGINLGSAIAKSIAATPLTGGLPFSAINAGLIGVQIGAILSKKPPPAPTFAQGGDVFSTIAGGNLHSAGGTRYAGEDGNSFEVERGEGIFVTSRRATNPALQMLNEANTQAGGRSMFSGSSRFLQDGGEAGKQTDSAMMARMITDAMMNAPIPILPIQSVMAGINAETKAKNVGVI